MYYNNLEVKCNDDVDDDLVIEPPSLELPVSNDFIDTAASADYAEVNHTFIFIFRRLGAGTLCKLVVVVV